MDGRVPRKRGNRATISQDIKPSLPYLSLGSISEWRKAQMQSFSQNTRGSYLACSLSSAVKLGHDPLLRQRQIGISSFTWQVLWWLIDSLIPCSHISTFPIRLLWVQVIASCGFMSRSRLILLVRVNVFQLCLAPEKASNLLPRHEFLRAAFSFLKLRQDNEKTFQEAKRTVAMHPSERPESSAASSDDL